MATKIQQILESTPRDSVLFGSWLTSRGLDVRAPYDYMKSGWLDRLSKGAYVMHGVTPTLLASISSFNIQLGKQCVVGAYTALELRGYSHYVPMGKPTAYFFSDAKNRLPKWMLEREWDMIVKYTTTTFLGEDLPGVEKMDVGGHELLVSSPERAILECLNMPEASASLLDIYYIMEGLTTLRPKLVQELMERCSSQKVKRLFLYMAEKADHAWYKALKPEKINLSASRLMATPTGKYISKYNMTIPTDLAEYE